MKKKILVLLLMLSLSISACGSKGDSAETEVAAPVQDSATSETINDDEDEGVDAEENKESTGTEILQSYIDEILSEKGKLKTPQEGIMHEPEDEWLDPGGIICYDIRDYDGDNEEELMIVHANDEIHLEREELIPIVVTMYEVRGDEVKKSDETAARPYRTEIGDSDTMFLMKNHWPDTSFGVSIMEGGDGVCLLCEGSYNARAYGDGIYEGYWGLNYRDNKFEYAYSYGCGGFGSTALNYYGTSFNDGEEEDCKVYYFTDEKCTEEREGLYDDYNEAFKAFFDAQEIGIRDDFDSYRFGHRGSVYQGEDIEQLFCLTVENTGGDYDTGYTFSMNNSLGKELDTLNPSNNIENDKESEEEDSKWAEEYLRIVSDWHNKHSGESAEGYSLIYLNDDDIPELCMDCEDYAFVDMDMYTFYDNKAKHMELSYDLRGRSASEYTIMGGQGFGLSYIERKGILFYELQGGGKGGFSGFIQNKDSLDEFLWINNEWIIDSVTGEEGDNYSIIYKRKDGTGFEDKGKGELYLFDDNKYLSYIENDYGFKYDDRKGIGDDKYYSFAGIIEELKKHFSDNNESMSYNPGQFPKSGLVIQRTDSDSVDYSDYPSDVGEIIIKNRKVSDRDWTEQGDDIIFAGKTYKNLKDVIEQLDKKHLLPIEKDEMINFITKVLYADFEADELTFFIIIDPDDKEFEQWMAEAEATGGEVNYVFRDEDLRGTPGYDSICSKYNDKAMWVMEILDRKRGIESLYLYGCESFLIADHQNGNITINMDDYRTNRKNDKSDGKDPLYTVKVTAPDGYVNFREGPGTDYEIIAPVSNGAEMSVLSDEGRWIKVKYDGKKGWVAASQVTRTQ